MIVSGTVQWENGLPMAGAQLVVNAVALRASRALVRARANAAGHYEVCFARRDLRADGPLEDGVAVAVENAANKTLVQSEPAFRVVATLVVDLTVPASALKPPSELERNQRTVAEALAGAHLADLTHAQLQFLAGQTQRRYSPAGSDHVVARLQSAACTGVGCDGGRGR